MMYDTFNTMMYDTFNTMMYDSFNTMMYFQIIYINMQMTCTPLAAVTHTCGNNRMFFPSVCFDYFTTTSDFRIRFM